MPDIAKCLNNTCPKRSTCYRYRVVSSEFRQSFAEFKPDKDGKCAHYWNTQGWPKKSLLSLADSDKVVKRIKS